MGTQYIPYRVPLDPYWSQVLFLASFDGIAGATSAADLTGRHTITFGGTGLEKTVLDTSVKLYGTASVRQPCGSATVAQAPITITGNLSDWALAAGDNFTIEAFTYGDQTISFQHGGIWLWDTDVGVNTMDLQWANFGTGDLATGRIKLNKTGVSGVTSSPDFTMYVGEWMYACVQRQSGTLSMYYGRVSDGTATRVYNAAHSVAFSAPANSMSIPGNFSSGASLNRRYWDSMRYTKGVGRYSGSSITIPTSAFPTRGT